jgi:hypothetical protein
MIGNPIFPMMKAISDMIAIKRLSGFGSAEIIAGISEF